MVLISAVACCSYHHHHRLLLRCHLLPTRLFFEGGKAGALEAALKKLCSDVEAAAKAGCQCIVLTDKCVDFYQLFGPGGYVDHRALLGSL